jgi:hypothetical protein
VLDGWREFYGRLGTAGRCFHLRAVQGRPAASGRALILLLLVNIRNAWDLTVFFAQRRTTENPPDKSGRSDR